jgi:cytochrome c551
MPSVRWSRLLVVAPVVAAAVLLGACGDDDDESGGSSDTTSVAGETTAPSPEIAEIAALVPTADVDAGADVFGANCSSCHGSNGGGGVGPNLQDVADHLSVEEQVDTVFNGRGSMPAWGGDLSDDEIAEVIRFTREGL